MFSVKVIIVIIVVIVIRLVGFICLGCVECGRFVGMFGISSLLNLVWILLIGIDRVLICVCNILFWVSLVLNVLFRLLGNVLFRKVMIFLLVNCLVVIGLFFWFCY